MSDIPPPPPAAPAPSAAGAPAGPPKSRATAGILGILLGAFGVHRFYLGYSKIGLIQIAATVLTCGAAGLWGFVEGIMILAKSESFSTDANGVPLAD